MPKNALYVGLPNTGNPDLFKDYVDDIFQRRWFSNNGKYVQDFERTIEEYLGVKHCIAVCNATVGLQIAFSVLGLKGEVILPANTFAATAHALKWLGIKPVFADIDMRTHNINPDVIESLISEKTTAIVGVHVWGRPCDTDEIGEIAKRNDLKVVYDAAHGFGSGNHENMIGNFGDCEVFSFHATKLLNTFEGGAITTNSDDLAKKFRLSINFGFAGPDNVVQLGTNGKMSEVNAAMGLASFSVLEATLGTYEKNFKTYERELGNVAGIELTRFEDSCAANFQYVAIQVNDVLYGESRDALQNRLSTSGVMARRYFFPGCHRMEPYRTIYPEQLDSLPNTDALCNQVLCLPTGTGINEYDIKRVCNIIATKKENTF